MGYERFVRGQSESTAGYFFHHSAQRAAMEGTHRLSMIERFLRLLPWIKRDKLQSGHRGAIYDQWELIRQQKQLMLQFYLLVYLFYEDDGHLDALEQTIVEQQFKKAKGILNQEHYKEIMAFCTARITIDHVKQYMETNNLTVDHIHQAISELNGRFPDIDKYKTSIQKLNKID